MGVLDKVYQLAKNSLIDYKLQLKVDVLTPIKREVDRISSIANKKDKKELSLLSTYEFFRLYMMLANYDLPIYDEMDEVLSRYQVVINNWTFKKEGKIIGELLSKTINEDDIMNHPRFLELFTSLDLSTDLTEFYLKMPFHAVYKFLRFKYEIEKVYRDYDLANSIRLEVILKVYKKIGMDNLINAAIECIKEEIKHDKEDKENLKKRIKYTNELLAEIEEKGEGMLDMLSFPEEWHRYLDTQILEELYNIVHFNVLKKYLVIEEEINKIEKEQEDKPLKKYLISKQLDYESLDEETRKKLEDIPDIVDKVIVLESLGIDINIILTKYIDCLINYDDEKIKFIQSLIKINVIKRDTVIKYLPLLVGDYYETIVTNYSILKDITDFNNLFYKDSILLMNTHTLRNILSVLKEYNLSKNNYMFLLCNYKFINIYDLMLEQDIPLELFISICHTDDPINTIKRIIIYRSIGEEYENSNHRLRKDVTNNSKIDEGLDSYIENIIPFMNKDRINGDKIDTIVNDEIVQILDSKYRREDVYIIGGTRVSRNKFLRNYQKKKNTKYLIDCLISDSIMNSSEYYGMYNELTNRIILTK